MRHCPLLPSFPNFFSDFGVERNYSSGKLYDYYVVTVDGLKQTVEIKWVPLQLCQRIRAQIALEDQTTDASNGDWLVMLLCP